MHSRGQRKRAIGTFIEFDHGYAGTVAELGYPTRACLRNRWNEHKRTGEVPESKFATDPRCTAEMKRRAVERCLEHGKSPVRTMGALGYPKSREALGDWIDEMAPGQRKHRGPDPKTPPIPIEKRAQAVAELEAGTGPAAAIAGRRGASRTAPYFWRRGMTGDDDGGPERKGEPAGRELGDPPDGIERLQDMLREAKMRLGKVQLELDVRRAALEMVKKDPGADPDRPASAGKAAMVTALGTRYRLRGLPPWRAWPGAAASARGACNSKAGPGSTRPPGRR